MSISLINNHETLARDRMIEQFKEECAPNLNKLLTVFTDQIQEVENTLIDLLNDRSLSRASGAQLDIIGSIVGVDREGRTDEDYLPVILVQIQVNNTGGEEEALTALLMSLSQATVIDIQELFPAKLDIALNANDIPATTAQLLRRAITAGVGFQVAQTDGEVPFAFEGSNVGTGFPDGSIPDSGGVFAYVITGN